MANGYIEYASKEYVGQQLENKADATHNHDSSYDMKGASDAALKSAKAYADEIVDTACSNITLSDLGITATADELNYVDGVTSSIQIQLDAITNAKADWNQNDETAIDYIKNRTHWIETGEVVLHDGTLSFVALSNDALGIGNTTSTYYADNGIEISGYTTAEQLPASIFIEVNGQKYECPMPSNYISPTNGSQSLSSYKVEVDNGDYIAVSASYRGYNALIVTCTANLINSNFRITVESDRYITLDDNFISSNISRVGHVHGAATAYLSGFMSASDKKKLDNVSDAEIGYLNGASSNIQGQLNAITYSKADWNQTDETAIDYIKNKPFGTSYEVGNLVTSSTLSSLQYNGSAFYLTVATNIPYYQSGNGQPDEVTYSDFRSQGCVKINGKSFSYKSTTPFYKTLHMYFVYKTANLYYDIQIRGSQSDLLEIQSAPVSVYNADVLTVPLSIEYGGTGQTSITDTIYTTARYRASSLHSSETTPTINGTITWTYE